MMPEVAFYRLGRKIVNNEDAIPEDARQVIYYSLAIGHHVGVMDCLSEIMAVPTPTYSGWLARLPEGEARLKLEGALQWSEIEINRGHVELLLPALNGLFEGLPRSEAASVDLWIRCLQEMLEEPALYLMLKVRE
jgi:hydrogenase-4 component J